LSSSGFAGMSGWTDGSGCKTTTSVLASVDAGRDTGGWTVDIEPRPDAILLQ